MSKLSILVIFGGESPEHEISCKSAASILKHIDKEKYDVRAVGITKEGKWIETSASADKIGNGSWIKRINNREIQISIGSSFKGMKTPRGKEIKIDCILPILHGKNGEDGTIQGLLELSKIPYIGSGVLASASAMDKAVAKAIVKNTGISQAKYYVTDRNSFASNPTKELVNIEEVFGNEYPLFVKPADTGSSVGVSKVKNRLELFDGIKFAAEKGYKILIEEAILGREMEVGIIGNSSAHPSPVGEIISAKEFYDYEAKYENPDSETIVIPKIDKDKELEIQVAAVNIYKAIGCRGLARVDFFLQEDGKVVFNEINTMPGFTNISMYPMLWKEAGIEYKELIDKLIELAMEEE